MSQPRAVPFYCPYCGDEDLRPYVDESADATRHGDWRCGSCTRVFALRFVGLAVQA